MGTLLLLAEAGAGAVAARRGGTGGSCKGALVLCAGMDSTFPAVPRRDRRVSFLLGMCCRVKAEDRQSCGWPEPILVTELHQAAGGTQAPPEILYA